MIPEHTLDRIREATDIVELISAYVKLRKRGQNYIGLCPFHSEKTPSFNVIPDKAVLKGTVRSYNEDLHRQTYRRILEMAVNMSTAFSCEAHMETVAIVSAVNNAEEPTQVVYDAAARVAGVENILGDRTMASEDMGYILEEIPGCYFFIGAGNDELGLNYPHHHPRFDFDERAMINGVAIMGHAAASYVMTNSR